MLAIDTIVCLHMCGSVLMNGLKTHNQSFSCSVHLLTYGLKKLTINYKNT